MRSRAGRRVRPVMGMGRATHLKGGGEGGWGEGSGPGDRSGWDGGLFVRGRKTPKKK